MYFIIFCLVSRDIWMFLILGCFSWDLMDVIYVLYYFVLVWCGFNYVILFMVIFFIFSLIFCNLIGVFLLSDWFFFFRGILFFLSKIFCFIFGEVNKLVRGVGIVFMIEDKRLLFEVECCLCGGLFNVVMLNIDGCVFLSVINCGGSIFVLGVLVYK